MGGKTSTTKQSVSIPPEVLARYTAVNKQAEQVAGTPFRPYSSDPNAFVAPINATQQGAIDQIQGAGSTLQPYLDAGTGMTAAGSGAVGRLSSGQINEYMSPYISNVLDTTMAQLRQQQQMDASGQIGNAIRSGAFGGDRAGIAAAVLANQQGMAAGQTAANILNQGYGQAVSTAQSQQGVEAANLDRLRAGGSQIANLGALGTNTALAAGQAGLAAGTLEQQTDQAGKQALYNQFLQQQGYPFQVAQFLANIAMGTGSLSGSNTTTTQPAPFFSDERLKHEIEPIGKTFDDQPIYRYHMGDGRTQIGLLAQDVEGRHPHAVGESQGYKTVDYRAATDEAADHARGGLRPRFAGGGDVLAADDIASIVAAQRAGLAPFGNMGIYGTDPGASPHKSGYVPAAQVPVGQLKTAGAPPPLNESGVAQLMRGTEGIANFGETASKLYDMGESGLGKLKDLLNYDGDQETDRRAYGGRAGFATGGGLNIYGNKGPDYFPEDVLESEDDKKDKLPDPGKAPGAPQPPGNTLVSAAMKILPFFFNAGGAVRHGYAAGQAVFGEPVEEEAPDWSTIFDKGMIKQESGGRQFGEDGRPLTSPKGAIGVAQVMPGTAPEAAKMAGLEWDENRYRNDPEYNHAIGKAYFGHLVGQFGNTEHAVAAYNAGPGRMEQALAMSRRTGRPYTEFIPAETRDYVANVMGGGARPGGLAPPSAEEPSGLGRPNAFMEPIKNAVEGGQEALGSLGGKNFWVPFLSGLGAMASSPSRYLGSAVLQGLGAGANSYAALQKQQADIGETQARTGVLDSQREEILAGIASGAVITVGNRIIGVRVVDKSGKFSIIPPGEYFKNKDKYRFANSGVAASADAPAEPGAIGSEPPLSASEPGAVEAKPIADIPTPQPGDSSGTDPATIDVPPAPDAPKAPGAPEPPKANGLEAPPSGTAPLPKDLVDLVEHNSDSAFMDDPASGSEDPAKNPFTGTAAAGAAAVREGLPNTRNLAAAAAAIPANSINGYGSFQAAVGAPFMQGINSLIRLVAPEFQINDNDTTEAQVREKIAKVAALNATTAAGQTAASSLNEILAAFPNGNMNKGAVAQLVAQMLVTQQKDADMASVFSRLQDHALSSGKIIAGNENLVGRGLVDTYARKYQNTYQRDKQSLTKLFLDEKPINGVMTPLLPYIIKNAGRLPQKYVDYVNKNYPGALRYLTAN